MSENRTLAKGPVVVGSIARLPGERRPPTVPDTSRSSGGLRLFLPSGGNANADIMSVAFASREVRGGRFQFRPMNFKIEV